MGLAELDVPPKSRIAVLQGLGVGLLYANWHVRLPEPTRKELEEVQSFCRDPEDWPILVDALAECCQVIVTYDKDRLEADAPIRCLRPAELLEELQQDQEFVGLLTSFLDSIQNPTPLRTSPSGTFRGSPEMSDDE